MNPVNPFPHFIVIKASAGAGKTFELTKRLSQFLILPDISNRDFKNILAITFSNMATKEMKERTIYWLKALALKDEEAIKHFSKMLFVDKERVIAKTIKVDKENVSKRAEKVLSQILIHYNDLQIKTIDSFMASIFSSMALDLGYYGDFEILLSNKRFLKRAFDIFLNERIIDGVIDENILKSIEEVLSNNSTLASFKWDINKEITKFFFHIYEKTTAFCGALSSNVETTDQYIEKIKIKYGEIDKLIDQYGLTRNNTGGFKKLGKIIKNNMWDDIPELPIKNPPVIKNKEKIDFYNDICNRWTELVGLISDFTLIYAKNYYSKVVPFFNNFKVFLENEKKRAKCVFIEDINKELSNKINEEWIPHIYFLLGETIFHYFIDEFQDTSPIQWQCLKPLLENSLSKGGSVFIVGDTKQAIYGFRNTDWQIMKGLIDGVENGFGAAKPISYELTENNRSGDRIIEFNEVVFKKNVKNNNDYASVADKVGLTSYIQKKSDNVTYDGYVECHLIEEEKDLLKDYVKKILKETIGDLKGRNYQFKDMAILVEKNDYVVDVANWLLSFHIPAISYSSLDIRKRPLIMEIFSLLSFLHKPTSNIDFATFLQSNLFLKASCLDICDIRNFLFENRDQKQLYTKFRAQFKDEWDKFLERLFVSVGYLPLYALLSEIYKTFNVFEHFKEEEGSLVKLLTVVSEFEGSQFNNLSSFLKEVEEDDDETRWDMSFPENLDAVKIMTIHKSKGLGFPVVISLLYEHSGKHDPLWIPRNFEEIRLVKINQKWVDKHDLLKKWYDEKKEFGLSNNLNTLYVCLTRAKKELYIIGVKEKNEVSKKAFPLDVIPFDTPCFGTKITEERKKEEELLLKPKYNKPKKEFFSFQERNKLLKTKKMQRGDFIHEVLRHIKFYDDDFDLFIKEVIEKVRKKLNFHMELNKEIFENFLKNEKIFPFFEKKEGREIYRELEFVNKHGRLFRCDRLIIDKNEVWVIDFKTGEERENEYFKQIKEYLNIVKDIWVERDVKGFIVYFDNLIVNEVLP